MNNLLELSKNAVVMGFAASCVEHLARYANVSYKVVYEALKRTDAFEKYIVPHYDVLHTLSREYLNEDLLEYLNHRGVKL